MIHVAVFPQGTGYHVNFKQKALNYEAASSNPGVKNMVMKLKMDQLCE